MTSKALAVLGTVLVALLAGSFAAAAQPPKGPRIAASQAFQDRLRDLGYVEGVNLILDVRWADGNADRVPGLVDEVHFRNLFIDNVLRLRVPFTSFVPTSVRRGVLFAYAASLPPQYRRAATYVDRILKGATPADLPSSSRLASNSSSTYRRPAISV